MGGKSKHFLTFVADKWGTLPTQPKEIKKMKIGLDAKRAVQNHTGLGNYSRFVIDIMSRYYPDNEYRLYAPHRRENTELDALLQRANVSICYPEPPVWNKIASLWRTWGMSRRFRSDRLDLFHGLSNELPLNILQSGVPSIVTVHDLIFLRFPQFYAPIDRHIYTYKYQKACEHCNRIIAISETTKRDLIEFWNIEKEKISVVYQGCSPLFKRPAPQELKDKIRRKYGLPDRYILYVGSIEERKNLLLVARALHRLPTDVHLVVIGRQTPYTEKVKDYLKTKQLERQVQFLHGIPLYELPAFYQCASLFVYPSRFEGFGIPIIEAIHSGIPVIAATGSCLEEAGGPASVYVHPDNPDELAAHISRILASSQQSQEMVRQSQIYVKRFEDNRIAEDIQQVYQKTLKAR